MENITKKLIKLSNFGSEVWAITYKGKFLKMSSGKSSWKKSGHAKNAFRLEFYEEVREIAHRNALSLGLSPWDKDTENAVWSEVFKMVKFINLVGMMNPCIPHTNGPLTLDHENRSGLVKRNE